MIIPDGSTRYKSTPGAFVLRLLLNLKTGWFDCQDELPKPCPLEAAGALVCDRSHRHGWYVLAFGFLPVERVDVRRWFEVAGFNVAESDHAACRKHMQDGPHLPAPRSHFPHITKR